LNGRATTGKDHIAYLWQGVAVVTTLRFQLSIGLLIMAVGCASSGQAWDRSTPEGLYGAANEEFEDGYYPESIAIFERLLAQFPYSPEARLGRLRLADVSFQKRMHDDAINRYSNFIGYHPNHPKVPYARLMIAESHAERIPSESFFLPPPEEKDLQRARYALQFYREVVSLHPDTEEASKAREGIQRVRRLLGKHELYVAGFYFKREKYKAALNRADGVRESYAGLGFDEAALIIAARSNHALGNADKAKVLYQEFLNRFPSSNDADEMSENLAKLSNASHD
jgi:outer membrane protein assembly factor BamD